MGMKPRKKSKPVVGSAVECQPFGDKEFWDRHERASQSRLRKDAIGEEVREFIVLMVNRFTEPEFDPRKDISWYLEQFGNSLRGDLEREKAAARQLAFKDMG